jgi:hypothetical protein
MSWSFDTLESEDCYEGNASSGSASSCIGGKKRLVSLQSEDVANTPRIGFGNVCARECGWFPCRMAARVRVPSLDFDAGLRIIYPSFILSFFLEILPDG